MKNIKLMCFNARVKKYLGFVFNLHIIYGSTNIISNQKAYIILIIGGYDDCTKPIDFF